MAEVEEKVLQYKAYLTKYFENPKEEKIINAFKKLDRMGITLDILQTTGIGKTINSFRKHEGLVGEQARALVTKWKKLVSSAGPPGEENGAGAPARAGSGGAPPGLQTETVSETTYGSDSGRVPHRLDSRSPDRVGYLPAEKVVKLEMNIKKEGEKQTTRESQGNGTRSERGEPSRDRHNDKRDRSKKRERTPESAQDDRRNKRNKYSHEGKHEREHHERSKVKVEKNDDTQIRIKLEKDESAPAGVHIKKEKEDVTFQTDKAHCDIPSNDKRAVNDRHEKHSSSKKHRTDKHRGDAHRDSRTPGANQVGEHGGKSHREDKSATRQGTVKIKEEPSDSLRTESLPEGLESVKIKTEPKDSDRKSRKGSEKSKSRSSGNISSTNGAHSSGERPHRSGDGRESSSKRSSSKSSDHRDKAGEKSKSKSSSSSSSSQRSKPKMLEEFDMFSMPNGLEENDDNDMDVRSEDISSPGEVATGSKKKTKSSTSSSQQTPSTSSTCKTHRSKDKMPKPEKPVPLTQADILGSLPETTPNYKPLPHVNLDLLDRKPENRASDADIGSKKNCRTQVYSGRRNHFLTAVPTLYDACLQVLKDNIDALDFVGGVPYDILKPVLELCTPSQLYTIEDANPQFIGETDELWKSHCVKDFRKSKPEEFESWREMYIRCHDARDAKLKSLTATISASVAKAKEPVRKTKLAYVDTVAKAPRDVRRRQRIHGTAGPMGKTDPLVKLSSHGGVSSAPRAPIPRRGDPNISQSLGRARSDKAVRVIAPMMRKTLKFMKSVRRK